MDVIDRKNCPVCGTPVKIVSSNEGTNHYEPITDDRADRLKKIIKWACSEEALKQSIRLPKGSSPMNGPERITAEICVENLQKALRRALKEIQ